MGMASARTFARISPFLPRGKGKGSKVREIGKKVPYGSRGRHRIDRKDGPLRACSTWTLGVASSAPTGTGFAAALALIFASELGDKTFFIAALLAMKIGALSVLLGSMISLGTMTAISVILGRMLKKVPETIHSTIPVGEYLAITLLVFFGIRSIRESMNMPGSYFGEQKESTSEWKEAEKEVEGTESDRTVPKTFWSSVAKAAGLVFVAEWGDRSMLATIALGAAQDPIAVFFGATTGHLLATAIAVGGGALLSKKINEKMIGLVGGILFLAFAIATAMGLF